LLLLDYCSLMHKIPLLFVFIWNWINATARFFRSQYLCLFMFIGHLLCFCDVDGVCPPFNKLFVCFVVFVCKLVLGCWLESSVMLLSQWGNTLMLLWTTLCAAEWRSEMDFYYISMIQTGKRLTIDVINHQRNMRTPVVDERRCRGRGEAIRQT